MSIQVIKRNKQKEKLNYDKINRVLEWATENISSVSASDVAMNAQLQFYDGITTTDIHKVLIQSATDMISEEYPNYQYVASKLLNYLLRKEIFNTYNNFPRLKDFVNKNIKKGIYDSVISEKYTEYDFDKIERFIKHERDEDLTYAGLQQLVDKYMLKDRKTGVVYETPQFMYILIAMTLFADLKGKDRFKKIKTFYDLISTHKISLPTPIMAGVRTPSRQYSSCFPIGQKVLLSSGKYEEIQNLEEGDEVITHNNNVKPIVATANKKYTGDLISIDTMSTLNDNFTSTSDHKILGFKKYDIKCKRHVGISLNKIDKIDKCRKKKNYYKKDCSNLTYDFNPEWIEAKDLSKGDFIKVAFDKKINDINEILISDYVDFPKYYEVDNVDNKIKKLTHDKQNRSGKYKQNIKPLNNKIKIDEDFNRFIGYFLAEGSSSQYHGYVQFTFNINEMEYHNDVIDLAKKIFGVKAFIEYNNKDNSCKIYINSKILPMFIENFIGKGFTNKFIAEELFNLPDAKIKQLLLGIFRGDGYAHSGGIGITLKNKILIKQLYNICLRLRLTPNILKNGKKGVYSLYLSNYMNRKFIEFINKDLHKITPKNRKRGEIYSNGFWLNDEFYTKIKKVKRKFVDNETVYDLQIKDDESFSVNNLSVHNCVLIDVDDNLDSIFNSNTAVGKYISKRAGIGLNFRLRAIGSKIRNGEAVHTGIIPFIKMFESTVKSCSQGGIRGGASTAHYPFWHKEIEDIIVLKNNRGNELNRVRRMDHSIQFCKLFYERFVKNENISLFSPSDVPGLDETFGFNDKFEELYIKYENDKSIDRLEISARKLLDLLIQERLETGRIYIMNIDNVNNHSSFQERISMSNLCQEINLVTKPLMDLNDDEGEIALCVLSALNLGIINNLNDLEEICEYVVRSLDYVIENQEYPIKSAEKMLKRRSIGVGVTNFAYWLVKNGLSYDNPETLVKVDELFEHIQYYLIKASVKLAKELGPAEWFDKTKYAKGILPIDHYNENVDELVKREYSLDWEKLRKDIVQYGMRNSTLTAIMPCESSSLVLSATNGIEPPRKLITIKKSKSGSPLPVVVPEINKYKNKYNFAFTFDNSHINNIVSVIQKWIDQGISVNHYYDVRKYFDGNLPISDVAKDLLNFYKFGGKQLYYANSKDYKSDDLSEMINYKEENKLEQLSSDNDCDSGACSI